MAPGSTLRFRVEDRTRGVESSTWSVVRSKKSGDLYLSGREIVGDLKISLHKSGITRMAWTAAAASSHVVGGTDRVISRWTARHPLPQGWALVIRLSIPDSALSEILPPLPERPTKPTVTLPAAGPGRTIEVRVLLGEPASGGLRLEGEFVEVGRMTLGDGSLAWVTAWSHPTTPEAEEMLVNVRTRAMAEGASERPVPGAFAWGTDNDSGTPFMLDAGDPRPVEARPPIIPRYDGPAGVVVRKMPAEGESPEGLSGPDLPRAARPTAEVMDATETPADLARELGVSPRTIRKWLREQGWQSVPYTRWRLSPEQAAEVRKHFRRVAPGRSRSMGWRTDPPR